MTWLSLVSHPIRGAADAAAFVSRVGFCTWGPVRGIDFPNLAHAMGETAWSVLDRTWFWKDDLHFERRVYYAKIIRGQPSFISPSFLPAFVAALGGAGRLAERDPHQLYIDGRFSREALGLYDYLVDHPRQPTRELRRGSHLRDSAMAAAVERGLAELQRRFLICKVDLTGRTRGTYSYVWDLAERFWPEAFDEARHLSASDARDRIRERLDDLGVETDAAREQTLFLWRD